MNGNDFYKRKGLKAVILYLHPKVIRKLGLLAVQQGRTRQVVMRRLIYKALGFPETM